MRTKIQYCLAFCMLIAVFNEAWAETFLIETKSTIPMKNVDKTLKKRIMDMESGFMEMLFANGHVFFNMYNHSTGNGYSYSHDQVLLKARNTGSDFLLELYMDETGLQWTLSQMGRTVKEYKHSEKISEVKRVRGEDPWVTLGKLAGQNMMKYLSGS